VLFCGWTTPIQKMIAEKREKNIIHINQCILRCTQNLKTVTSDFSYYFITNRIISCQSYCHNFDEASSSILIMCANSNKFELFWEELLPKTNYD